jgi:response regulator RpfG family c-di-GMP phosphodiesterase
MASNVIICVDDERSVLESLKKVLGEGLGNDYLIEIAENGLDAIELFDNLINSGYRVPVIISDYIMPRMKGDELLKIIHNKNNRCYKIMLTGQAETSGVSNAVNFANLFRIISKPWNSDELLFTVREASTNYIKNELIEKQYKELLRDKEIFESFKAKKFVNPDIVEEKDEIFNYLVPTLLEISTVFERGFFLSPTKHMINMALKISEKMQLSYNDKTSLVISTLILHKIMQTLPDDFVGIDPSTLEGHDIKKYFRIYNESIDSMSRNKYLNKYALILSQLWEHADGTGLPHQINEKQLGLISQILNLVFNYHLGVYKILPDTLNEMKTETEVIQTPDETAQRHANTMKSIFKNVSWYDIDLIAVFKSLMHSKASRELFVEKSMIKIYIYGQDIKVALFDIGEYYFDKEQKLVIPIDKIMEENKKLSEAQNQIKNRVKNSLETSLDVKDLRPGMIAGENIYTKFGRLLIKKDEVLSKESLEEILAINKQGLLVEDAKYLVNIPREM